MESERLISQNKKGTGQNKADESEKLVTKEKSPAFNIFLLILICSGNYFFGYQLAIFNVVSDPLLKGIFQQDDSTYKSNSSLSGFLFSLGCAFGSLLEGVLTKYVGMIRLIYLMEFLNIATSILLIVQNLKLIMALRFIAGMLGGLSISLLPLICNTMFPPAKAAVGGAASYLFIVVFILISSLQNPIFGGSEGLKDNIKIAFSWPAVIGVIRVILMTIFLIRFETPKYLTEHFSGSVEDLKLRLLRVYKLIY